MERRKITEALARALDEESEGFREAKRKASAHPPEYQEGMLYHELSRDLSKVLAEQPEFEHAYMIKVVMGAYRFDASRAASAMVQKALSSGSVEEGLAWVDKVLDATEMKAQVVMVLWGIESTSSVDLTDRIRLVPIEDLPDCRQKNDLLNYEAKMMQNVGAGIRVPMRGPKVALVTEVTLSPLLHNLSLGESPAEFSRGGEDAHQLLHDACGALTVVGPSAPIPAELWSVCEDPDFELASMLSGMRSWPHVEIMPMFPKPLGEFDAEQAKELVPEYLELEGKFRNRVTIALDRLRLALSRRDAGDQAIETCIALETLLSGTGDDKIELGYRVALRAALLVGAKFGDPNEAREAIKKAYGLRSTMVHTGSVGPSVTFGSDRKRIPTQDLMKKAMLITSMIIAGFIEEGQDPDWSKLELGGARGT